ncbi:hypothetical protein Ddye_027487 [Dipteronia dyeriana]|uniref:Leucine-rich repeat-containing N-terminal plant-type domain-containing protein n=1 Tax=Dipteronia dyeriana TaxID=168575 RepID=A0AAD9WRG6_9ROSI|nr:hypothetical protein Ddye_027487 [Dipteronia dyeriana]
MKADMMSTFVSFFFFELIIVTVTINVNISFSNGSSYVGCIQSERQALLSFKQDLTDPSNRLASWVGDGDCCKWTGVVCNNLTGHVVELNLQYRWESADADEMSMLFGKINPSLHNLKHLIHLDLSLNNFEGMIPPQLGNLSNLQFLNLSYNSYELYDENLLWISNLSSLKHLDLSDVDLSKASNWLLNINSLPSLVLLRLKHCGLQHFSQMQNANFSSLTTLDLSFNDFNFFIPSWVFGLIHLDFLDLNFASLEGPIPYRLGNLTSLKHLDLSLNHFNSSIPNCFSNFSRLEYLSVRGNNFQGKIPRSMERLCNLRSFVISNVNLNQNMTEILEILSGCVANRLELLDLSGNQIFGHLTGEVGQFKNLEFLYIDENSIVGPIPHSLGKLSSIKYLDFSFNKLNGTVSENHFANLTRLKDFDASQNLLTLKVNFYWVPPFQLESLNLRSCLVGPHFPLWLRSQKSLYDLDISNAKISDVIPSWFWKSLSQFTNLNLSHNQIYGEIPPLTDTSHISSLDLSSNKLSGLLPPITFDVNALFLSNNALSGSISQFLCFGVNESKSMEILKLENNFFFGELPDCWRIWQYIVVLNLGNNKFTGSLPTSMRILSSLRSLTIHKNSLSGITPFVSLQNCSNLEKLDAAENQFVGYIPRWIGERFPSMKILDLRSNKLHGILPVEFCHLASLQIFDISYNNLSGSIPRCIYNFSKMVTLNSQETNDMYYLGNRILVLQDLFLVRKGIDYEYSTILNLVRAIDLSSNNFSGEIPREVTSLAALQSLNLSHNSLTGRIPENVGAMRDMESIDFSSNQLSGEIPHSISSLTFLSQLNLSNNNLSGKIPSSTQIQGFDASCFTGNDLCGSPFPNCTVTFETPGPENGVGKDGNEHEVDWFYVSMALGFIVGFWGLVGPLLINRKWRYMYYGFLDRLWDKIYFAVRKYR